VHSSISYNENSFAQSLRLLEVMVVHVNLCSARVGGRNRGLGGGNKGGRKKGGGEGRIGEEERRKGKRKGGGGEKGGGEE
jgi:hypothetical protein